MTCYFQGSTDVMLCLGNFVAGSFTAIVWHLIVMLARWRSIKVTWVISLTVING